MYSFDWGIRNKSILKGGDSSLRCLSHEIRRPRLLLVSVHQETNKAVPHMVYEEDML